MIGILIEDEWDIWGNAWILKALGDDCYVVHFLGDPTPVIRWIRNSILC